MHAQEELDVFDIVFNYEGKILDVPQRASSSSQPLKRKSSSRQCPMRRTSPRKPPPGKIRQTELSPISCPPLTKPVATLKQSMDPGIDTLDAAAKLSPTSQKATTTANKKLFSVHDSEVHSDHTSLDGEPDSLVVKVPLTMCSAEVLRLVSQKKSMDMRMLKNHLTSHDVSRVFSCKICCKRFKKKAHLNVHMQTHTRDKVSACHICKKKFYRSDHLNKHLKIHFREETYTNAVTGDIMYVCKYCSKICRTVGGLSKHRMVHFMKPQICPPPPSLVEEREKGEVCAPNLHIALDLPQDSEKSESGITDTDTDGAMAGISGEGANSESFGGMDSELDLSNSETFSEVEEEESEEEESLMIDSDQSSDEDNNIAHFLPDCHRNGVLPPSNGATVISHMMAQNLMSCRNSYCRGKPYKCDLCGRRSTQSGNLNEHYQLHRQIPHKCGFCGKVFMSQLYLKRHICAKHSSS